MLPGFSLLGWNVIVFLFWNATLVFLIVFDHIYMSSLCDFTSSILHTLNVGTFPGLLCGPLLFKLNIVFPALSTVMVLLPSTWGSPSNLHVWLCNGHYCSWQLFPALPPSKGMHSWLPICGCSHWLLLCKSVTCHFPGKHLSARTKLLRPLCSPRLNSQQLLKRWLPGPWVATVSQGAATDLQQMFQWGGT